MVSRTGGNPLVSILSQSPRSCAGAGSPGGFCGLAVDVAGWLAELVGPASVPVDSEPPHAVSPAAQSTPTKMMWILTSG